MAFAYRGGGAGVGGGTGMNVPRYGGGFAVDGGGFKGKPAGSMFNSKPVKPTPSANIQAAMKPYQVASPTPAAATSAGGTANQMQNVGSGLMDPNSQYFQQLLQRLKGQIGGQGAAQKRSAALTAAESGFGAGQSAELAQMTGGIDEATMAATGQAAEGALLQAPQIGADIAGKGAGINLGVAGSELDSRRLAETMREFDVGAGFTAQGMANEASMANQDAMMKMFAMMLGGF